MIEVRPFQPDDLPALWALAHLPDAGITEDPDVPVPLPVRRVPPSGPPDLADPARTVLAAGGELHVGLADGHLVGVGGLRPVHGRPRLGRVIRLRVHPAVRRRGVGRELMRVLEDAARRRGLTDLLLDVGDHQPEALAFYRALGWSETWRETQPEAHWQTVWHHRSLTRDHLAVEVRPCASDADVAAAERGLSTRAGDLHRQRWADQQAGGSTYLLAWDGSDVVGHVLLRDRSAFPEVLDALGGHPEAHGLAVADRVLRRGVGTALMGAAAGVAAQQGASLVGLAIEPDADAAAALCRRLGWSVRTGLRPVHEWSWTDEGGGAHLERDRCAYWTLSLPGADSDSSNS